MAIATTGPQRADLRKWNGVTLPAGGFSVRASSTQAVNIAMELVASATALISSVTTTRAHLGDTGEVNDTNDYRQVARLTLTDSTTITGDRNNATGNIYPRANVVEIV